MWPGEGADGTMLDVGGGAGNRHRSGETKTALWLPRRAPGAHLVPGEEGGGNGLRGWGEGTGGSIRLRAAE